MSKILKISRASIYKKKNLNLTYVNVNGKWHYICVLIDLFNREIIGYSAGKNNDISLVTKAFSRIQSSLNKNQYISYGQGK
ncbi:DDE-type integrase/transposase/recombinase [Alkalibaculum sporogenes]